MLFRQIIPILLCTFALSGLSVLSSPKTQGSPNPQTTKTSTVTLQDKALPKYKHIFIIIAENKAYEQIIGNPNAPIINQLAKKYGLATNFYAEVHPSEGNYIALIGGSTFGVHDDDAYYCHAGSVEQYCSHSQSPNYADHTITSRSLIDQLEEKHLTWKGYFESIPLDNLKAVVYPSPERALYAVKHNGFMNFKRVQDDPNLAKKIVGLEQLSQDLKSGNVPNYSHIILNQCHEMHGLPECRDLEQLIKTGDTQIGQIVQQITSSKLWSSSDNNAIIITWDEDNNPPVKTGEQGCCGFDLKSSANFGGGHIPTIVITNHGPRGVVDSTPYNHYSLLRTIENVLGIHEYLNEANSLDKGVKPMTPLFK